jgi:leucyl aminopeptidase (aminopeptidase T)
MAEYLDGIEVEDELREGARNAVRTCLRIRPGEKVTVITDERTAGIAASLRQEIKEIGARCTVFLLEDFGPRPHTDMAGPILEDLATSQVSIFAACGQPGELQSRMQMTRTVTDHRLRHAHMINIDRRIMREGMRADFVHVDAISSQVLELVREAKVIRATTAGGTDIQVELDRKLRWLKTSGLISPDTWGNLPGGEVFTCPARVDGIFVVDGVVGDYLCAKYGSLERTPLTIEIRDSRLAKAYSHNRELEADFWKYCHTDEHSDRVGEFAIGTNVGVRHVIGNILQDEKIPGVHIAFGNPNAEQTGADWTASTHIDVVGTRFDIWIDDRKIMERGEFHLPAIAH